MTVGGKVYASEHAARDVEIARLLCGGHGTKRDILLYDRTKKNA
jgi:hypothetical protein